MNNNISYISNELLEILQIEAKDALTKPVLNNINRTYNINPSLIQYNGNWINGWTNNSNWINFGLIYNNQILPVANNYPNILKYLLNISDQLIMAGFSLLTENSSIPEHVDEIKSNGLKVFHLGLLVPDNCYLTVDDTEIQEENGKLINFDDSIKHKANNLSSLKRLILYFKIE